MEKIFNTVEIEINHACNRVCSYCPNSEHERIEKGHMSLQVYNTLIEQLASINYGGKISYDFYNEPMLSPNLENFIEITKIKLPKCSIELYSNGTLLTLEKFRRLYSLGVNKFIITKHELSENYEFDNTFKNLTSMELELLYFRSFNDIKLTNRGGILKHIHPEIENKLLPCHLPLKMLTVTIKGNIIPCFEDFYQKNQMGNILDTHILDVWNSRNYREFRSNLKKGLRHKYSACQNCNRLEVL